MLPLEYQVAMWCAEGLSNKSIALRLNIDEGRVKEILLDTYLFYGYGNDLAFNALDLYQRRKDSFHAYMHEALELDHTSLMVDLRLSYWVNVSFDAITKGINNDKRSS